MLFLCLLHLHGLSVIFEFQGPCSSTGSLELAVVLTGLHNVVKMCLNLFFCFYITATTCVSVCPSQLDHCHAVRGYFIMCLAIQKSLRAKQILYCVLIKFPTQNDGLY